MKCKRNHSVLIILMSRQAFEYGYFSKNLEDIFKYFEEIMGKNCILDGNLLDLKG